MNRSYTAKGPHKRPCDLCGAVVIPGDRMDSWMWVADEPCNSNIIRAHSTCVEIMHRVGIEEWGPLGAAFEDDSELVAEAAGALAEARKALVAWDAGRKGER